MINYDYIAGKHRILDILNDTNDFVEVEKIPNDQEFTYDNGYYGWVSAIFVDIRNSTELFTDNKKSSTAKIIRCFTSEIIEILRNDSNLREIGIRGDCVYGIYATPQKQHIYDLFEKACLVNTFLAMLDKVLLSKGMTRIKAGIGLCSNQDLVIKAGRNKSGIDSKVWIGKAVTYASKLSNMAMKQGYNDTILMSSCFYNNIIDIEVKNSGEKSKYWFTIHDFNENESCYGCSITYTDFMNWINEGMNDE